MCAVDCTSSHLPLPSPIPRSSVLFLLSSIPTEISLEEPLQGRFQMWCRAGGLRGAGRKLSAVHCVNTCLQVPFFFEFDLAALATDLDQPEHLVILRLPEPRRDQRYRWGLPRQGILQPLSEVISPSRSVQAFQAPCRFNPFVFRGLVGLTDL